MSRLKGKVALVTGAARGQGRSHVLRLASEGVHIIAIDRCASYDTVPYPMATPADLKNVAEEARALGVQVVSHQTDITNRAELTAAVDDARAQLGPIEIVVANAGIIQWGKKFWEWDDQSWDDTMDVNLRGAWHTCAAVAPSMIEAGRGGSIIVTASVAGLEASPGLLPYTVAKHGVIGLVRCMAAELGEYSIRVNAIAPSTVDTDMINNPSLFNLFRPDLEEPTREDTVEIFRSLVVLPRPWLEASEVSDMVAYLASDSARSITGTTIPIDLGKALK
ncbi:mycofactocin-coupled SDR family oxidoreductase [Pseudonocardia nigra]|uniref:mycofactocin-coupled SDR family oxidoreductase n=1 Tax=Pseudonocardia nigra TaxID=1921578 RepID=UPI001C5D3B97|nr:mycofactocin-coupled SDR family oxidoreductase [Pseudonocardia nigra]